MPPKGKGKKGKKGDDDDFWANAGESVAGSSVKSPNGDGDDDASSVAPSKAAGYTGLEVAGGEDDDDQDNFMAMLQKRKSKKKDKKSTKDDPGDAMLEDAPIPDMESKAPKEMTADDLDEEFGPVKEKGKKKKGKDKKATATPAEGVEEKEDTVSKAEKPAADNASDNEEGEGTKILSKKEKEKLKKEKERAKKKAQAAAKKAQAGAGGAEEPKEDTAPKNVGGPPEAQEEDEDNVGGGGDAASKKKKKKKKAKKDEDDAPAPAPAASGKKKAPAGLSALRAALEEKRRLEEEAKRKEEEERRRIEEEERRAAEEARKKEEERQRKKEKEKAKKEQARKEGRLLTDKQKRERQAAEIRRQALLQSGAVVEGLSKAQSPTTSGPKKVVYGKRQRGPAAPASVAASSTPSTPQASTPIELEPEPEPEPEPKPVPITKPEASSKVETEKDWDASSTEETKEGLKSDWDASSDEEEKAETPSAKAAPVESQPPAKANAKETPATKPTPTIVSKPVPRTPAAASTAPAKTTPKLTSKAPPPPPESSSEESSEEESSSEEDDSSEEESSDEDLTTTKRMEAERKAAAAARRKQREEEAKAAASKDNLRSPICVILGHVDTGKTKLLDKIRQTNVQEGEAGGITQQIGATYFPVEAIRTKTAVVNKDGSFNFKIPGLLIIDTPGHESFTNLRSRGSSLCNIAILVVDIMHGLEPQTIESLGLLKQGQTPFIIALNKIDRLYSWKAIPNNGVQDSLEQQNNAVKREFEKRSQDAMLQIAEQGLNCELYWKNTNPRRIVNIVPTSAITGEGVPDMIKLLVDLTQTRMVNSLMYISTLECTVLEVKVVEGLGTTIDVILSNGYLREGDKIVICGLNGPIVTQVRALLTPQPLRELRVKSAYVHNKEVKAANGVKVVAPDLDKAIAGSKLLVCGPDDDEDDLIEEVMRPLEDLLKRVSKTQTGVHVQASTLGSLEALLSFLESSKIPVSGIQIGPVHKKDVRRAMTQLEKAQEMACILCFDVPVDREAEKLAEESGVRLFKADIIYHLFDAFTAYHKEITEAKRKDAAPQAVWPCRLKIIAIFAKRDPIIVGVDILEGTLRVGTPLCVVTADKQIVKLGRITSLEINHRSMEMVKKSQAGGGVAVKIERAVYEPPKMAGRHFTEADEIVSLISRQSIDVLKETFRNEVSKEEWLLIKNLKSKLGVP